MRGSRLSKLAALAVFVLIALTVIGGIAWATVTSYELALEHVRKAHERKIDRALWQLDSYILAILNSETARSHDDYRYYQAKNPVAAFSGRRELDVDFVIVESPLAMNGPPHDWIDVYFEMEQSGEQDRLSTPLLLEEDSPWAFRNPPRYQPWLDRARRTWDWLQVALPAINLRERVASACQSPAALAEASVGIGDDEPPAPGPSRVVADRGKRGDRLDPDYRQRKKSLGDPQLRYLPPVACVDPDIADGVSRVLTNARDDHDEPSAKGTIGFAPDPFIVFWLGPGPDGNQKLAFVREMHRRADTSQQLSYQGFVGDWVRLKPELLEKIDNIELPGMDLEPLATDAPVDDPPIESRQMYNLPVRLKAPDIPGGAPAAAWQEVRGTLITTWVAAVAVLIVAGLGLRNLVKLTERRMQFAYAVTHELRTPLTTFRLYSDMLSAGLVADENKQAYLDTLYGESVRLSNLVEGVLEYARLENQKVRLNPKDTDGPTLLNLIRDTLERRCHEHGISPKAETAMVNGQTIRTDVDVVNRIAGVLVNNAVRHARGGDNAKVVVRLAGDNGEVHLDVIDTGPGVERRDARAIFKPFRRGRKSTAAAHGGIGLGLALARSWAQLLGGRVELAARHDPEYGGAHFRLTFPARLDA